MLRSGGKDFPGGTVDKGLPANAGDTSSIPGLGKFHRLWCNQALVPQLLSLCSAKKRSHCNEKLTHHNEEWLLFAATRECLRVATKTQCKHPQKIIVCVWGCVCAKNVNNLKNNLKLYNKTLWRRPSICCAPPGYQSDSASSENVR